MAAHPKRIEIAPEDRPVLEKWANAQAVERRLADRARIVLMAAEGRPADVIAQQVGRSAETVRRQRASYERHGLDGLRDRPKTGRPLTHGHEVRAKLIALACTRPPDTPEGVRRERWTHAELAAQVGMEANQGVHLPVPDTAGEWLPRNRPSALQQPFFQGLAARLIVCGQGIHLGCLAPKGER